MIMEFPPKNTNEILLKDDIEMAHTNDVRYLLNDHIELWTDLHVSQHTFQEVTIKSTHLNQQFHQEMV